jgi:hypothetical protein
LTNKGIDQLTGSNYEILQQRYEQFIDAFKQEELKNHTPLYYNENCCSRTAPMSTALDNHRYWYLNALTAPKSLFNVFRKYLLPLFERAPKGALVPVVSLFWTLGMSSFVDSKVEEYTQYREEVRNIFNSEKSGKFFA